MNKNQKAIGKKGRVISERRGEILVFFPSHDVVCRPNDLWWDPMTFTSFHPLLNQRRNER